MELTISLISHTLSPFLPSGKTFDKHTMYGFDYYSDCIK